MVREAGTCGHGCCLFATAPIVTICNKDNTATPWTIVTTAQVTRVQRYSNTFLLLPLAYTHKDVLRLALASR